MRKINLRLLSLAVIAALITFSSCKKDKEAAPEEEIVGKWNLNSLVFETSFNGQTERDTTNFEPGQFVQFNKDGSVVATQGSETGTGKWQLKNNKLLFTDIEMENIPSEVTVSKLTKTDLELGSSQIYNGITINYILKLKK